MSYNKSSTKLLTVIDNYENNAVLYTELDGNYSVGDKLYIMVLDNGSPEYILDSFQSSGTTYQSIGYELLAKDGNKLTLDINYSGLTFNSLTQDNCYIGRVYIKNGSITRGVINGSILYNVSLSSSPSGFDLLWYQGIVVTAPFPNYCISNMNFNSNTAGSLVMKSEVLSAATVTINSYYTIDNYGIGLSIINLSSSPLSLVGCNINSGVFNNCELTTGKNNPSNTITSGELNNCFIGQRYIINGGDFINCTISDNTVSWVNGTWDNNLATNCFKTFIWSGGTWRNGTFPSTSVWLGGRFVKGFFYGAKWVDGTFGTKYSTSLDTIFYNTNWYGGSFNGGIFSGSTWLGGIFNNGTFSGSTWTDGIFNNGIFTYSTWIDGTFNGGTFSNSTWTNGTFNDGTFGDGTFGDSIWLDGVFNGGLFTGVTNSDWYNGGFYGGIIGTATWHDGSFYKGSMFNSKWLAGDLFFGYMNSVEWTGGTWHNGIANDISFWNGDWENGILNYGAFYGGNWWNGSFNSGTFTGGTNSVWYNGNFYSGIFSGKWIDGTFYNGNIQTFVPQVDIIGRQFTQYNKSGLFLTKKSAARLPAKKKF